MSVYLSRTLSPINDVSYRIEARKWLTEVSTRDVRGHRHDDCDLHQHDVPGHCVCAVILCGEWVVQSSPQKYDSEYFGTSFTNGRNPNSNMVKRGRGAKKSHTCINWIHKKTRVKISLSYCRRILHADQSIIRKLALLLSSSKAFGILSDFIVKRWGESEQLHLDEDNKICK